MEEIERRIQLNENRILIYNVSKGYIKPTYIINEGFFENNNLIKSYSLSQWDDYGFHGFIFDDEKIDTVSFEFNIDHPLYFPLFHLLNYDDELLIDDDDTREYNMKYMLIYKKEDKIYIDFVNKLSPIMTEKFSVFIKNIVYDGRSKIDANKKDTKKRLSTFFSEIHNILINRQHQISIEECLLNNSTTDEYNQMKKIFKRKI